MYKLVNSYLICSNDNQNTLSIINIKTGEVLTALAIIYDDNKPNTLSPYHNWALIVSSTISRSGPYIVCENGYTSIRPEVEFNENLPKIVFYAYTSSTCHRIEINHDFNNNNKNCDAYNTFIQQFINCERTRDNYSPKLAVMTVKEYNEYYATQATKYFGITTPKPKAYMDKVNSIRSDIDNGKSSN